MHIVYRLNLSSEEPFPADTALHDSHSPPQLLRIAFEDDSPQYNVSRVLRQAWTYAPPATPDDADKELPGSAEDYLSFGLERGLEDLFALQQSSDQETVETGFRLAVYELWNHVFYDASNFLGLFHTPAGVSHFHPGPNSIQPLALHFPQDDEQTVKRSWDTNVLLTVAHMHPQSTLSVCIWGPDQPEGSGASCVFVYFPDNATEVVYVRRGTIVTFRVKNMSDGGAEAGDLAAVMVCAAMCDRSKHVES